MNKVHFKDPLCYLCLLGTVVASWFVTQEIEGSNTAFFAKIFVKFYRFCYVMLWPALTWRGQEWAQHVQGQLLHTCIMQTAGSPHVMEL